MTPQTPHGYYDQDSAAGRPAVNATDTKIVFSGPLERRVRKGVAARLIVLTIGRGDILQNIAL